MIIEVSVACIAGGFLILVVFLIIGIVKFYKTNQEINKLSHSIRKHMDELGVESLKLIKNVDETTVDVKKKLQALDVFFKPLSTAKQEMEHKNKKSKEYDLAAEIIEGLSAGMILFNKIKGGIREYGKSR
jgi:uncharacterized protein YoxC